MKHTVTLKKMTWISEFEICWKHTLLMKRLNKNKVIDDPTDRFILQLLERLVFCEQTPLICVFELGEQS